MFILELINYIWLCEYYIRDIIIIHWLIAITIALTLSFSRWLLNGWLTFEPVRTVNYKVSNTIKQAEHLQLLHRRREKFQLMKKMIKEVADINLSPLLNDTGEFAMRKPSLIESFKLILAFKFHLLSIKSSV